MKDVPPAVMAAADKAAPGGTVKEVEKETRGDDVVYEIKKIVKGKKVEIKVAPDGKVVKIERDDDDDD